MAIFGIGCHFPGGVIDLGSHWKLIKNSIHTSTQIPFDRWDSAAVLAQSDLSDENKLRASFGSFVNDIDSFDSSFFRISKAEASKMSPQQRILLECSFITFSGTLIALFAIFVVPPAQFPQVVCLHRTETFFRIIL